MKANFKHAAIITVTCLFAAPGWADETGSGANTTAPRTVAAANTAGVKRANAVAASAAHATPAAGESRAQRQPPAGVEVLRVVSDRDAAASGETKEGSN